MSRPRNISARTDVASTSRPAISTRIADLDGALSRLSLTVQTALVRAERNRAAGRGGRP